MTEEDWGVEIVTLTVGARAKEGKGGWGGEKKKYSSLFFSLSLLSPRPLPTPFHSTHFLLTSGSGANCALKDKTPALQAKYTFDD